MGPIDGTLSTTNPGLSGPGSNGNIGVLNIHQNSRTGASPSEESLLSYLEHLSGEVLALSRVFQGPCQLKGYIYSRP